MRKGSTSDGSSFLPRDAAPILRTLGGVAHRPDGQPLASAEIINQPFLRTREGGRENVLVRGVEPVALLVHDSVKIVEGRMFEPSQGEVIVGTGVAGRYAGATVGDQIKFGNQALTNGSQGITPVDKLDLPFLSPFQSLDLRPWYWTALVMALIVLFINARLREIKARQLDLLHHVHTAKSSSIVIEAGGDDEGGFWEPGGGEETR